MSYATKDSTDEGAEDGALPHTGGLGLLLGEALFFLTFALCLALGFTTLAFGFTFCITLEFLFLAATAFGFNGLGTFPALFFLLLFFELAFLFLGKAFFLLAQTLSFFFLLLTAQHSGSLGIFLLLLGYEHFVSTLSSWHSP